MRAFFRVLQQRQLKTQAPEIASIPHGFVERGSSAVVDLRIRSGIVLKRALHMWILNIPESANFGMVWKIYKRINVLGYDVLWNFLDDFDDVSEDIGEK